jgi:hypothetical protein
LKSSSIFALEPKETHVNIIAKISINQEVQKINQHQSYQVLFIQQQQ